MGIDSEFIHVHEYSWYLMLCPWSVGMAANTLCPWDPQQFGFVFHSVSSIPVPVRCKLRCPGAVSCWGFSTHWSFPLVFVPTQNGLELQGVFSSPTNPFTLHDFNVVQTTSAIYHRSVCEACDLCSEHNLKKFGTAMASKLFSFDFICISIILNSYIVLKYCIEIDTLYRLMPIQSMCTQLILTFCETEMQRRASVSISLYQSPSFGLVQLRHAKLGSGLGHLRVRFGQGISGLLEVAGGSGWRHCVQRRREDVGG